MITIKPAFRLLSTEQAEAAYTILTEHAGAPEGERSSFVHHHGKEPQGCHEWRFGGLLASGGKFRNTRDRLPYVDCYSEHINPTRRAIMDHVNAKLARLFGEPTFSPDVEDVMGMMAVLLRIKNVPGKLPSLKLYMQEWIDHIGILAADAIATFRPGDMNEQKRDLLAVLERISDQTSDHLSTKIGLVDCLQQIVQKATTSIAETRIWLQQ